MTKKKRTSHDDDETGEADMETASELLQFSTQETQTHSQSTSQPTPMSTLTSIPTVEDLLKRIDKLEKTLQARQEEETTGRVALAPRLYPNVFVDRELLLQKLSAKSLNAKIKGVYDLLVPVEKQALYSGRGRGKNDAVPKEVFGAMKEFFRQKLGRDESAKIVESINDKASQARLKLRRRHISKEEPGPSLKKQRKPERGDGEEEEEDDQHSSKDDSHSDESSSAEETVEE